MQKEIKELLDAVRDRLGVVRKTNRPPLNPQTQFERDFVATELSHKRTLGIARGCDTNSDMLGA